MPGTGSLVSPYSLDRIGTVKKGRSFLVFCVCRQQTPHVPLAAALSSGHKQQESGKRGCRYPGVSFRHAGKGTAGNGQIRKIFCGKMLDGVAEKAHKAVRANELVMPARAAGKEIFPDGKKVLDAGLKMRHTSPSRQRVAPAGPRKKLSRNEKNLLTAKTKRRKQLLRAE